MAVSGKFTTPVLVWTRDNAPAGANAYDNRTIWTGLDSIVFDNGGLPGTFQWYRDQGPLGMPAADAEPRAFCTRGGCHWTFSGKTLLVRLQVAWSWLNAVPILVDGVAPSSISGVFAGARDVLSCDAATYGLTSDAYVDVLVVDGLPAGSHTVSIVVDNPNAARFFSIAGFKTGFTTSQDLLIHKSYIVDSAVAIPDPNVFDLALTNRSDLPALNVALSFPPGVSSDDFGAVVLLPLEAPNLAPGAMIFGSYAIEWAGDEVSDVGFVKDCVLSADYPDPTGLLPVILPVDMAADSAAITFTPSPWFFDVAAPGGLPRRFADMAHTTGAPWNLVFTFEGDNLDVTVQRSAGWGVLGLYDGPTDGATLLRTLDCSVDDGGALHMYPLTGLGPGVHTAYFRCTTDLHLPAVFVSAAWEIARNYTTVTETVRLVYDGAQPWALPVEEVTIGLFDATFAAPDPDDTEFEVAPVRTNQDVVYTETLTRFPTFCVCYQSGYRDILLDYDVLILDPIGAKPEDVIFWQSMGIKCYGYISSGEEVGFFQNRFDFSSALAPRRGTGPGGFSPNYMFTRNPSLGPPDKNGVWASYYMDPRPASGWLDRILNYYCPQVFGGPEPVTGEVVTVAQTPMDNGSLRFVFATAKSPLDQTQDIIVTTADLTHTYVRYRDYTYDAKTGCFVFATSAVPAVVVGQTLKVSYTRLGHHFDGLFWDTVDTPDVYSGPEFGYQFVPGYKEAFIAMINAVHAAYPDKKVISNRGFTILPEIIAGCNGVMFETWLTAPDNIADLANTDYHKITDEASVAYNEAANDMMAKLRLTHVFDVYSLNYAKPGDTALKAYCARKDRERGYLSWQTIITLANPNRQTTVDTPGPPVNTNAFTLYKRKGYFEPGAFWDLDDGGSTWDLGSSVWVE